MALRQATKAKAKLRMGLLGLPGSGKTYTALQIATGLGGKVAALDSEHGSMSKYAGTRPGQFQFAVDDEFEDFSIETYIRKIQEVAAAGYDVLIIDSLSHAWAGKGGALEQVDRVGGKNKFTNGWGAVTPLQTRLVETILGFPGHVIVTLRTKADYVVEDKNGRSTPKKVGMAPIQREGFEYELDVVVSLDKDGHVNVEKTRCPDLSGSAGALTYAEVPKMVAKLKAWLSDGVDAPAPKPAAQPGADPHAPYDAKPGEFPLDYVVRTLEARGIVKDNYGSVIRAQMGSRQKKGEFLWADATHVLAKFQEPPPPESSAAPHVASDGIAHA